MEIITRNPSPGLDVRPFTALVGVRTIEGTVTHYPALTTEDSVFGMYTVDAVVDGVQYKFTMNKQGTFWTTGIVSVFENGKIESLDAFVLSDTKIEQLFELALTALTTYRNHGVHMNALPLPIDPTRISNV